MKVGIITTPNSKGQIVIPKTVRDLLGITPNIPLNLIVRDNALHMYPVREINSDHKILNTAFLKLLKKTQGAWADDKTWVKTRKKRRKIELEASKKRKQAW